MRNALALAMIASIGLVALLAGLDRSIAKHPAASAAAGSVAAAGRVDSAPSGVPVLCHHFLTENRGPVQLVRIVGAVLLNLPVLGQDDVWTQTTSAFEQQIAYLAREGYESVDLADLVAWQRGTGTLPERPVIITFDDGDRSVLRYAYPILKRYGFKATLFVVTGKVGQAWEGLECLDWDEMRFLNETGVFSIESHTHDLHRKVKTSEGTLPVFLAASRGLYEFPEKDDWREVVFDDLKRSRDLIEREVGVESRYFAWPYGFGDAKLDSIAVAAGFRGICTLESGHNAREARSGASQRGRWQRYEVNRYTITARTTMRALETMLE